MESDCQGCNDYDDIGDKCMAPGISNWDRYNQFKIICPCAVCVVKMMCNNLIRRYPFGCIDFYHARGKLWQQIKREDNEKDKYPM
jgi:hypothetical protein